MSSTTAAINSTAAKTARSVYLSRLRRAFLLRVHPDRFRHHPNATLRSNQAALVKALSNRMDQADFGAWQQQQQQSQSQQASSSSSSSRKNPIMGTNNSNNGSSSSKYSYVMEKRDGSLLQTQLDLSQSVDDILENITQALQQTGAVTPPVPVAKQQQTQQQTQQQQKGRHQQQQQQSAFNNNNTAATDTIHRYQSYNHNTTNSRSSSSSSKNNTIDHRYDIISNRGRDLKSFLFHTTQTETKTAIQERRANRMDAQALAQQVRQLYQFQAVNATPSQWSSASVAVLLRRFLELHREHGHEFQVSKFYPLQLIFTPTELLSSNHNNSNNSSSIERETERYRMMNSTQQQTQQTQTQQTQPMDVLFSNNHTNGYHHTTTTNNNNNDTNVDCRLDVYGGILKLHPACTNVQWLEALQLVTPTKLQQVQEYRQLAVERTKLAAATLGIAKLRKGHTCSSWEYHAFLQQIVNPTLNNTNTNNNMTHNNNHNHNNNNNPFNSIMSMHSSSIAVNPNPNIIVSIESSQVIRRRAKVTAEGHIQLGAHMDFTTCQESLHKLIPTAIDRVIYHKEQEQICKQIIAQIQATLGLQKVYRASPFVTQTQYLSSLQRILGLVVVDTNNDTTTQQYYYRNNNNNTMTNETTPATCLEEGQQQELKRQLAGNSLGISASGQFCHLADDGSIVIPHNWMYTS